MKLPTVQETLKTAAFEMIGGLLAGWEYVEGVELTPEYIPIAHKRLEHWVK